MISSTKQFIKLNRRGVTSSLKELVSESRRQHLVPLSVGSMGTVANVSLLACCKLKGIILELIRSGFCRSLPLIRCLTGRIFMSTGYLLLIPLNPQLRDYGVVGVVGQWLMGRLGEVEMYLLRRILRNRVVVCGSLFCFLLWL